MNDMQQQQWEPVKNYVVGFAGISIGITDITNFFQAIAAIGGAILVIHQVYRTFWKKK